MTTLRLHASIFIALLAVSCQSGETDSLEANSEGYYLETYRPQIHFSPEEHWMNDPNGMVYYDDEYHLFYQFYPDSTVWGPMHWGHAVSKDLVKWQHLPIALYPDDLGYIFSGSAVIDWNNTSGLQQGEHPPMVAIFTQHLASGEKAGRDDFQTQSIAWSNDKGRTWKMYDRNPVIPNTGIKDFRDPKVFRHEDSDQWIMILTAGNKVMLYGSPNLKDWKFLSEFGADFGAQGGVWECPDLFSLKAENNEEKWVMLVSINPGGPNGGSATQYFIGDFDGKTFTTDQAKEQIKWLDYGRDNYAGVTWSDIPETDGRRLFIGWMSNWDYAQMVPTEKWRSAMTVPRSLHLFQGPNGYQIASRPVTELRNLAIDNISFGNAGLDEDAVFSLNTSDQKVIKAPFRTEIIFDAKRTSSSEYGLILRNPSGDQYRISISQGRIWSDRTNAGKKDFDERFAKAPHQGGRVVPDAQNEIRLEVIFDKSSAEIFVNNGQVVITDLLFPYSDFHEVYLYTLDGQLEINRFKTTELKSIWQD